MARTSGTVLSRSVRVPPLPPRPVLVGVLALIALSYAVLLASAAAGAPWPFAAAAVLVTVLEPVMARSAPVLTWAAREVELGLPWRWAVQSGAVLGLLARQSGPSQDGTPARVLVAAVVTALGAGLLEALAQVVELLRKSPVLARNIDVRDLGLAAEPRWLLRLRAQSLLPAQLVVLLVGATAAGDALSATAGTVLLALAVLAVLAAVALAASALLRTRRRNPRTLVPRRVQDRVLEIAPQLLLFHGAGPDSLYQVDMWLRTFESSSLRTLVVVRDRESLRLMAPTTLPVVCIPAGTVLMSFPLPSARAALFVANASANVHLLRRRGIATAFIGHGDSDKASSSNPFAKVYDELWVAGPAGAERYSGISRDGHDLASRVVVVGRPQAPQLPPVIPADGIRTVLYAPTWEGWGDEPHHCSLSHLGVDLVRRVLATPGIRLVYRPHPLTGTRDRGVARRHGQVLALLRDAGAPDPGEAAPPPYADAQDTRDEGGGDDLSLMLRRLAPPPPPTAAQTRARLAAEEAFWAAPRPAVPRIAGGPWPGLVSCFRHSDLLVADVSSVVTDWVSLDRPYALVVPPGLDEREFRLRYPSASAAALISAPTDGQVAGLDQVLSDLLAGRDPLAAPRRRVREDLLGVPPEGGSERFEAALHRLAAVEQRLSVPEGGTACSPG